MHQYNVDLNKYILTSLVKYSTDSINHTNDKLGKRLYLKPEPCRNAHISSSEYAMPWESKSTNISS